MKRALSVSVLLGLGFVLPTVFAAGPVPMECAVPEPEDTATSADPSWRVLDGCVVNPPRDSDVPQDLSPSRRAECHEAAATITRVGTDADRNRLLSLFDDLPEDSPMAEDMLGALLDQHVESALAALAAQAPGQASVATAAVAVDADMPDYFREAPEDLQEAWRLYQGVAQAGQERWQTPSADEMIEFQWNEPAFHRDLTTLLRGQASPTESIHDLTRFTWVGQCGMGSDRMSEPRAKALLIASLQLGQVDRALAASGGIGEEMIGPQEGTARWDRRLLTAAGIDWERFGLGAAMSGPSNLVFDLARYGSNRTARSLLAAVRFLGIVREEAPDSSWEQLLWPLSVFVEGTHSCTQEGVESLRGLHRDPRAEPIADDLQEEILDLLAENVGPGAGRQEAETASNLLVELSRPESRPAFRTMLRSPYDEVRRSGAIGLRALGETIAEPRPWPPVRFRVVIDDKPVARSSVAWTLRTVDWEDLSSSQSDDEGVVGIPRDLFLDPRRPVPSVGFRASGLASSRDVWFDASLDAPTDLGALTTVSVRTGSLTIVVPPALLEAAAPPTVQLWADNNDGLELPISGDLAVAARITFPHLQYGRYRLQVHYDNRFYASPSTQVAERPMTTTVSDRSMDEQPREELAEEPGEGLAEELTPP
jgi:hypothetical protein